MVASGSTSGFIAFRDNIVSPALRAVADHWHAIRGKRRMPPWADLKPSLLGEHLSSVWAFDYDRGAGLFTGRLAGSNIMVGFGKAFPGTPLSDLHPPHVFTVVHDYFTRTVSEPACCRWSGKLFRIENREIDGERIVLPMGTDAEGGDGVLGASWYDYPVWRAPDRLELIHDKVEWCMV
jgi:hypothetical protein